LRRSPRASILTADSSPQFRGRARVSLRGVAAVALCGLWLLLAVPGQAAVTVSPTLRKDDQFCLGCHDARSHAKNTPFVSPAELEQSAHRGLKCSDCHTDITSIRHQAPLPRVDCTRCHSGDARQAALKAEAGKEAPRDQHSEQKRQGAKGLPTCVQCHGTHRIKPPTEPDSQLGGLHIADTCGACHPMIAVEYRDSVHGQAALTRNADVPTCLACHPEHARHEVKGVLQEGVVAKCTSCHEDPGLQHKYAIPGNRLASYLGSYHGAATELGDSRTANCASCHENHHILPSRDPRSSVHRANLPKTCGHCHPNAGEHFAEGAIHLQPTLQKDPIIYLARIGYMLFIAALMSSFIGYICLDLIARARRRFPPSQRSHDGEPEQEFERLTLNQRIQHWVLITSFTTLLITGLPLAAPESAVSRGVITFLGGMGARAVIHRGAALALVVICAYHLGYVLLSRAGYRDFRQLIPWIQDGRDVLQMLKFYLGFSPVPARFGRYNFIEKFEYLAVGWGSVVMIGTGALLWAPHLSLAFLPKWMMDVALIVHSWEAILAFLAIIIWHMYNVHLNPAVFPMSRVWLTGKISLPELQENHPLEYERMLRARKTAVREEEEELV
jgi:cytochrome b subunit of formate dehydrogenase